MSTNGKMQIFYGVDNPSLIRKANQADTQTLPDKSAPDVALSPQPTSPQSSTEPITQIVKTLQSVKTDTPEAQLNKDSMTDNQGNRITFNDEETRSKTFKGVENPNRLPIKKK